MKNSRHLSLTSLALLFCLSANVFFAQSVEQVDITFRVDMRYQDISPQGVFLSSSVNSWEQVPLSQINDTKWEVTLKVPINYEVLWKYLNGPGGWEPLPADGVCAINSGINNPSRTFITPTHDVTLETVCFGFCEACNLVSTEEGDLLSQNFRLYPNPASEVVTLAFELEQPQELVVHLADAYGRIVLEKKLAAAESGEVGIELAGVVRGVYFASIKNELEASASKPILLIVR